MTDGRRSPWLAVHGLWPTPLAGGNRKSVKAMQPSTNNGRRTGGGNSSPPALEQAVELDAGILPREYATPDDLPPLSRAVYDLAHA